LCAEGWSVNRKRVQRLWRQEGLRVAQRARKRRRLGEGAGAQRLRAERPNHVWAIDFMTDQSADGRMLRLLNGGASFERQVLAELGRMRREMHAGFERLDAAIRKR
jgi:putative transposase